MTLLKQPCPFFTFLGDHEADQLPPSLRRQQLELGRASKVELLSLPPVLEVSTFKKKFFFAAKRANQAPRLFIP